MHMEKSNMRTRERVHHGLVMLEDDLDEGIGELLEVIDEELDFEEENEAEEDNGTD